MAAHYSRLPTSDPDPEDSVAFDFSQDQEYGEAFDYSSAFEFGSSSSRNKDFKSIYTYGRHSHMQDDIRLAIVKQSFASRLCSYILMGICLLICLVTFPISAWFCFKVASDCEKIVIFRLGRIQKVHDSGVVFVIPFIDRWKRVDVRMKAFNVPPLQLLTQDAGIIEMGADVYYKVTDVVRSVTTVQDLNNSLRMLVRNILTNHVVKHELATLEGKSYDIVAYIQAESNKSTGEWGVSICRIEFSPIKVLQAPQNDGGGLPGGLGQDALTQVFQQLAGAFTGQGDGATGVTPPAPILLPANTSATATSAAAAAGAAVSSEDVKLVPGLTPSDILMLVRGVLTETLVRSVGATFEFHLAGTHGGVFYMDLKNGSGRVGEGKEPSGNPDVTLELSVADMQKMFIGQLNPLQSYMSGRLKVGGDLSSALKLEEVMDKVVQKMSSSGGATGASQHTIINI